MILPSTLVGSRGATRVRIKPHECVEDTAYHCSEHVHCTRCGCPIRDDRQPCGVAGPFVGMTGYVVRQNASTVMVRLTGTGRWRNITLPFDESEIEAIDG